MGLSENKMECLIGMQFDDFVMVAADQTNARYCMQPLGMILQLSNFVIRSIMVMKSDQNKFFNLSDRFRNFCLLGTIKMIQSKIKHMHDQIGNGGIWRVLRHHPVC